MTEGALGAHIVPEMSFAEILESWERGRRSSHRGKAASAGPDVDMDAVLRRYPPSAEDASREEPPASGRPAERTRSLRPQAELDLHGLRGAEAEEALERFVLDARGRGLRKVLIIHGKGNHSPGQPVLPRAVRAYLEKCPYTGAFGPAEPRLGGRGATWVLLRGGAYRSR